MEEGKNNPVAPGNPEEFLTGLTGLTGCYLGAPEARQEGINRLSAMEEGFSCCVSS